MWLGYFDLTKIDVLSTVLSKNKVDYLVKNNVLFLDLPRDQREFVFRLREQLEAENCSSKFRPFHEREKLSIA